MYGTTCMSSTMVTLQFYVSFRVHHLSSLIVRGAVHDLVDNTARFA